MIKLFEKEGRRITGICFTESKETLEEINNEFVDFTCEDAVCVRQVQLPAVDEKKTNLGFGMNRAIKSPEQAESDMEVIVIQEGCSFYDYQKQDYEDTYFSTLYLFHNDWLMCDGRRLFVVDKMHIQQFGIGKDKYSANIII